MPEVILYPTETVYALGVNPFNERAWRMMCDVKGRPDRKPASWLVKDIESIRSYAVVPGYAEALMEKYLPGPLTIIFKAKENVPVYARAPDGTVSFRVSSDEFAQNLIAKLPHPLTCTSANLHGFPTLATPEEILKQLGQEATIISVVYDDGPRAGKPSTVVRCVEEEFEILREGEIDF